MTPYEHMREALTQTLGRAPESRELDFMMTRSSALISRTGRPEG